MPSSVPSPPSTSTRSTSVGERLARGTSAGAGGRPRAPPFRPRRPASTSRAFSQASISASSAGGLGAGAAWRRCRPVSQRRFRRHASSSAPGQTRCSRNSRLPSVPVIGDSTCPRPSNPSAARHIGNAGARRARARPGPTRYRLLPTSVRPASNCGLTRATTSPPGGSSRRHDRQDVAERDERHVDGDEVEHAGVAGRSASRQVARVDVLDDGDARIAADLPVQLVVADVEGDDAARRRAGAARR